MKVQKIMHHRLSREPLLSRSQRVTWRVGDIRESGRGAMTGWLGNLGFTLRVRGATDDFNAGE